MIKAHYSLFVDREPFEDPKIFRHIKEDLDFKELDLDVKRLSPSNGREIGDVYKLSYDPSLRIRGRMTKEEVGNLTEILFGVGGISVAVVSNGKMIMSRVYRGGN